ncbi:MAG: glycosyltransferase family 2 protein, partial [Acidobacteria bacterium]|nr:glycosyltransferase family 2 protein [Acidobacteriota bacterium]
MSQVSIVAPAFNEAENVARFHAAVRAALADDPAVVELLFVDDGSTDETAAAVRLLRQADARVRLVRLTRNFGNQAAFLAGIAAAKGDAIITMDADLQHPPAELPKMLAAWRAGARGVQMVRRSNPDAGWLERLTSSFFHHLLRHLTNLPLREGAGDFRLIDRKVAAQVLHFSDARPFYRGMVTWLGVPGVELSYQAAPRTRGRSGIRLRQRIRLSLDAITAMSIRPLRMALLLGLGAIAVSLAYLGIVVIAWFAGHSVPGYPTIIFAVVFLGA